MVLKIPTFFPQHISHGFPTWGKLTHVDIMVIKKTHTSHLCMQNPKKPHTTILEENKVNCIDPVIGPILSKDPN